jgi:hypothetical protein
MKLKFYVLIASAILLAVFAQPAGATPMVYHDISEFEGSYEHVTNYELVKLSFEDLGSDSAIEFSYLSDNDFSIAFLQDNTAFGAVFHKVTTDSPASVTVSSIDSDDTITYFLEEDKKQFFGLTTGGEGYIGSVMVTLGDGVTVSKVWHNTPVPEPTTLLLLGSGLLGLAGLGRKKFLKRNGKRSFDVLRINKR